MIRHIVIHIQLVSAHSLCSIGQIFDEFERHCAKKFLIFLLMVPMLSISMKHLFSLQAEKQVIVSLSTFSLSWTTFLFTFWLWEKLLLLKTILHESKNQTNCLDETDWKSHEKSRGFWIGSKIKIYLVSSQFLLYLLIIFMLWKVITFLHNHDTKFIQRQFRRCHQAGFNFYDEQWWTNSESNRFLLLVWQRWENYEIFSHPKPGSRNA